MKFDEMPKGRYFVIDYDTKGEQKGYVVGKLKDIIIIDWFSITNDEPTREQYLKAHWDTVPLKIKLLYNGIERAARRLVLTEQI